MRIKYSPSASDKLQQMKKSVGKKVVRTIVSDIRKLSDNPRQCPSIEKMIGISSPYFFLHVEHNYVFYRIDRNIIYIVDIYNEREDFMWKMFGIRLRTQESIDYWGE